MKRVVLVLCVFFLGQNVNAMSPMSLEADPCEAFLYKTWTLRVHQVKGGHTHSDLDLLAPVGMRFTLTPAPGIKVLEGANGRSAQDLQEFWSSFNGDLECNVSYKGGVTFHRLEGRGIVAVGSEMAHPHYFTMVLQTCDSGKELFTIWITDERPTIEATPGSASSSLCPNEGVYPNFDDVPLAKHHEERGHGSHP